MDENEIQKENKSYEQAEIPPELRYDPFPGTTYSASGKPVNMPPEEAAPQKKTKKKKERKNWSRRSRKKKRSAKKNRKKKQKKICYLSMKRKKMK